MKGNKYMEQMKERINHLIYGRFEDGTGVYGKLFNVQKIEESAEKKPYYKLSINLGDKYCVILDTREIVNIYDFTEICSEMDSKLEDFGINPRFEKAEIMDEIILNWSGYTEEEKKKLSSLIRTKMDDDIIVNLMEMDDSKFICEAIKKQRIRQKRELNKKLKYTNTNAYIILIKSNIKRNQLAKYLYVNGAEKRTGDFGSMVAYIKSLKEIPKK